MKELWKEELTPDQVDQMIERIATRVHKYRMETPAIFALEMHKPLANVGASFAVTVSPILIPFLGFEAFDDYTRLLSKRENWDRLIHALEETRLQPDKKEQSA